MAVAIAVYAVGRISGAHLNPAVTVGLASIGSFPWPDVPGYIAAQMVGAFVGAALVWLAYLPHWAVTSDKDAKLGVFCTGPAIRNPSRTSSPKLSAPPCCVFGVLAIAANAQTLARPGDVDLSVVFSGGLQPLLVGILVWASDSRSADRRLRDQPGPRLRAPARARRLPIAGKRDSDWSYAWIPSSGR